MVDDEDDGSSDVAVGCEVFLNNERGKIFKCILMR
jgi:hypothetical protein